MKKALLLITAVLFTATTVSAAEPLLLEPLSPAILQGVQDVVAPTSTGTNGIEVTVLNQDGMEAVYTPINNTNMVPQNDAAKGKPTKKKRIPRVRIETKQGRQTNTQWNPGGKGTKSFF